MTNPIEQLGMPKNYLSVGSVSISVLQAPLKGEKSEVSLSLVEAQASLVSRNLIRAESYSEYYGGCIDGRTRISLLNGQKPGPRFQIPGGPVTYAANLCNLLGIPVGNSAIEVFTNVTKLLLDAGIKVGMHQACAALNNIQPINQNIYQKSDLIVPYVQQQRGQRFHDEHMSKLIENAKKVDVSGIFAAESSGQFERQLVNVFTKLLGHDEAGRAITKIDKKAVHNELTFVRIKTPKVATIANDIFKQSIYGEGSYIHNDSYAFEIEKIVTSGPHSKELIELAATAREFIIKATALALPNPVLSQIDIT